MLVSRNVPALVIACSCVPQALLPKQLPLNQVLYVCYHSSLPLKHLWLLLALESAPGSPRPTSPVPTKTEEVSNLKTMPKGLSTSLPDLDSETWIEVKKRPRPSPARPKVCSNVDYWGGGLLVVFSGAVTLSEQQVSDHVRSVRHERCPHLLCGCSSSDRDINKVFSPVRQLLAVIKKHRARAGSPSSRPVFCVLFVLHHHCSFYP